LLNNKKHNPLLIAEIGGNHEGNFQYAKRLTALAIESGADAIKFQIYTGDALVSSHESPDRNLHFKKFELSQNQHIALAEMVRKAGRMYVASVWDVNALDWINPYISFYKIGSGDLTAYPILKAIAQKKKPIVISTGLATEKEVIETVHFLQKLDSLYAKSDYLAVLQCTSMYPIPKKDAHLNVMRQLHKQLNVVTGYSDHTEGTLALETAAAMGAKILEFHFTDTREGKSFRDHKVSLTCSEVLSLRKKVEEIRQLQGNAEKQILSIEIDNGHEFSFRRAVYPSRDILKGEILDETNLTVLRPCAGIDAREFDNLIGSKLLEDIKKHQKLDWNLIAK
jgi:sialic acid synthase SpsE